jgi:hypothetical protein
VSRQLGHLARRFVGALSRTPPSADDDAWIAAQLEAGELALWATMPVADRRHSVEVARRLHAARPAATRDELAAALLHDVGKVASGLGTFGRVAATLVGPRTARFRAYHDHEAIGASMAAEAGSSELTVALIGGSGPPDAAAALQSADDAI